ncbi:protein tyrosine phosphatase [Rhodococcus sp. HNM0569]|uniref:arsenate reductase/protein-tyrosine-phosphatase family protein n=1 Tax=Rhodococcus sp. HNM0569 TaxID=2716340 RepID=UPI00146ACDC5|nr:protein tyrosine phosphatase [Rhodococcus sp. HNM0569]NLU83598.1 protein tyrosine phosphatase [Rhodococcus sp. HNM0569]
MRVLFVCTGNICRSPIAERLAVAYAQESGTESFEARSAGVQAVVGHAMDPTAAQVLESLGGDPEGFTARMVTADMVGAADLVLTMSERQREKVLETAPSALHRTFTLREALRLVEASDATDPDSLASARTAHRNTGDPEDIVDPIGQEEEVFVGVGDEIAETVGRLMPLLTADSPVTS